MKFKNCIKFFCSLLFVLNVGCNNINEYSPFFDVTGGDYLIVKYNNYNAVQNCWKFKGAKYFRLWRDVKARADIITNNNSEVSIFGELVIVKVANNEWQGAMSLFDLKDVECKADDNNSK